jgi:hypothetical protein
MDKNLISSPITQVSESELKGKPWRRSCICDGHSCRACKKADGQTISGPDEDLSKIHTGRAPCRCIPYCDLSGW